MKITVSKLIFSNYFMFTNQKQFLRILEINDPTYYVPSLLREYLGCSESDKGYLNLETKILQGLTYYGPPSSRTKEMLGKTAYTKEMPLNEKK